MKAKDFAKLVYTKTVENQGFSVNLDGREPVNGYMVSYPDRELKVNILALGIEHVLAYLNKNLGKLVHRGNYLGTWIDQDIVYIDISLNVTDRQLAFRIAKQWHQQAIYDVLSKEVIYL